jgi:uncharacterized RDD family membrane protein YckC
MPLFPPGYENWPMFAILGALALMMLTSARRRGGAETGEREANEIVLATSGQRLTAGLIDAAPIILSLVYVISNQQTLQDPDITWIIPVLIAIAIYLIHTTLCELISGRTLGKFFVGLQVVAIDGKRARIGSILIRNLLRVIDVFPIPLALLILTSPMRQRLGDLLGGTIVIVTPAEEDEDDRDSQ